MNDPLTVQLERVVPQSEQGRADWDEVLALANVMPEERVTPRAGHRHLRYVVLAVTLVLAVLLATPAFGFRDRIVDLFTREGQDFGGATVAPTIVQRDFREMTAGAPEGMDPQVLPLQTRLVARVQYEGVVRSLWAAPTRRGGFCFRVEDGYGGCQRNGGFLPAIAPTVAGFTDPRTGLTEIRHIGGTVTNRRIVALMIEFRDGLRVPVRFTYVSAPIEAGFFGYDVPEERRVRERGPTAVIGLDRNGEEVWRDDSFGRR